LVFFLAFFGRKKRGYYILGIDISTLGIVFE